MPERKRISERILGTIPTRKCWAGVWTGGITGLFAGIGVAIPLGSTLFKNGDDVDVWPWFVVVVLLLALIGFFGGAWGGALAAKCWETEDDRKGSPYSPGRSGQAEQL